MHAMYDSFGVLKSETNNAVDLIFGNHGKPLDEVTGLQNNLERWLDAYLAQWISEDPINVHSGDFNFRRYVLNSPLQHVDPDGLTAVGHHWIPISILLEFKDKMTRPALEVGMGSYSGPTNPSHLNDTYGGVSHPEYSKIVKQQIKDYMEEHRIKKLTPKQIKELSDKFEGTCLPPDWASAL